jgi:hypothetical protein
MPYSHIQAYYARLADLSDLYWWRAWHYENAGLGLIHHYELDAYL